MAAPNLDAGAWVVVGATALVGLLALVAGALAWLSTQRLGRTSRGIESALQGIAATLRQGRSREPSSMPGAEVDDAAVSYFYLTSGGVPRGPASLATLQAMLADGRLADDAWAAPSGSYRWQSVASLTAASTERRR